ncbi:MAG: hypothetical protein FWG44_03810 [Oscillospiraceae bacterium]|nr:hypothetical protein [Oscillospiraceae bacterium]
MDTQKAPVKKNALTTRITWILLALFFLITVISQIYVSMNNTVQTEAAMIYESSDSISFKGVHVRNERLVRYGSSGVISYNHQDGSKLGKNSVVALSYKTKEDILLKKQIDELTEKIKLLETAEILANTDNSQLESYINQITNKHTQLMWQVNTGDYSSISQLKDDYLSLQCKKHILRNDETNYRAQINRIENQIVTLRARMSQNPVDVLIEEAGYFVSRIDGYESLLNYEKLSNLQKSDIENIIREPELEVANEIIGKMIDGYKWRFVGILDTEKTHSLYENLPVKFRVGGNTQIVEAVVFSVKRLDDGTSIIVFECDTLTAEFASRRVSQFNLLLEHYSGIRIPSAAVHVIDGEQGVFVKNGAELVFRKIKALKIEKDYFLVENTTELSGFISLYDSVVIRGRDLYEGKIV